jgi:uncharacterized protein YerC
MQKYGVENFYYEVLQDQIPVEELDNREQYYIEKYDSFKNGYNSTTGGDGRVINKIDDVSSIIDKLQNGELIKDIAAEFHVCEETICRSLRSYGIKNPSDIQGVRKVESLRSLPREKIKSMYLQGKSYTEIANELNVNQRSVSRVIKEYGIGNRKHLIDYDSLDLQKVLDEYENDVVNGTVKRKDFEKKYGFNKNSIKLIRKRLST